MKQLLLLFALPLFAQVPDCSLPINVPVGSTVPFNIGPFDNRTAGCTTWQITYNSYTYSALSIVVQTADNVSAGVPGSWSTFTAVSGSNPNTATTEAVSTFGGPTSYFPWLRVQLTSATGAGTISGRLYGWRIPPEGSVIIPAGTLCPAGTPCVVVGNKTPNSAAPGTNNVGVLPALANAAAPSLTENDLVLESVDLSGRQRVLSTSAGNAAELSGQQSVTGTAVALATNTTKSYCVKAALGNTITVFVGPSGITTSTGYPLSPGESVCANLSNTNLTFVIASTTGASIGWFATN